MIKTPLTATQAKRLLMLHAYSLPDDPQDPRMEDGFLGHLRPYKGTLNPKNYHEIMAALRALGPSLGEAVIDKDVVSACWGILHLGHSWAVDPQGMLQRNKLISGEDVSRIREWLDCIGYVVLILFESGDVEAAFSGYDNRVDGSSDDRDQS